MPRMPKNRRSRPAAAALLVLLAALGLAACGGSSKGPSSATNASANASATNGKGRGQFKARASALRECLKKEGITLPERKASQGGDAGPGGAGDAGPGGAGDAGPSAAGAPASGGAGAPGGPYNGQPPSSAPYGQPPNGAQGGGGPLGLGGAGGPRLPKGVTRAQFEAAMKKCGGGAFRGNGGGFDTARGRQRYAKFAECMRKDGIELPAPNTSGNGPIFDTKGIDTNSAAFKAASAKCMKELRPGGGVGGGGAGGG